MDALTNTPRAVLIGAAGLLVAAVVVAVALIARNGDDGGDPSPSPSPSPTAATTASPTPGVPVRILTADWASDNAESLQRLVETSTHVFIGEVLELTDVRIEQLSPGRGEPVTVPVSTFEVSVETAFKGDLGATTLIEQIGGITQEDGEDVLIVLDGDEPLSIGATYLFFSIEKENGTVNTPPFGRFVVQPDGTVQPLDDWKDLALARQLQALSAGKLHDLIVTAVEGVIR